MREPLKRVPVHLNMNRGHNLALTVFCLPKSLDSGYRELSSGVPSHPTVQGYLVHANQGPSTTLQQDYA